MGPILCEEDEAVAREDGGARPAPFCSLFFALCPRSEDDPLAFMNERSSSSSVMGSLLMTCSAPLLDRVMVVEDSILGFRAWFENSVKRSAVLPFSSALTFFCGFDRDFAASVPFLVTSLLS
jgi:hypothetical protein